jgi:hypothetical protein
LVSMSSRFDKKMRQASDYFSWKNHTLSNYFRKKNFFICLAFFTAVVCPSGCMIEIVYIMGGCLENGMHFSSTWFAFSDTKRLNTTNYFPLRLLTISSSFSYLL